MDLRSYLLKDTAAQIQEQCQPFLKQANGEPMYRGYDFFTSLTQPAKTITVRKDRQPRDTSPIVHGLMDAYFQKKFGAKVRSEGLFATGRAGTASYYGKVYYVFPVGDFKFIWGKYNGDAIRDTMFLASHIRSTMPTQNKEAAGDVADSIMDSVEWQTDDLPQALRAGAELAILCDTAVIVPKSAIGYTELTQSG